MSSTPTRPRAPRPASLQRLPLQHLRRGAGFCAMALRGADSVLLAATDPYVAIDRFRMSQPTFGAHPHAGFSAVSYVFSDSESGLLSRDSLAGEHTIEPGDLQWTLAGSGLVHEELPARPGRAVRGLQMFINLPAAQKQRAPRVMHLAAAQMPRRHGDGWVETQVFGGAAPLALPVHAALRIVDVEPGASYLPEGAAGEQACAWLLTGQARIGLETLAEDEAWALRHDDARPLVAATPVRLAVFSGRPLREPVVQHGPFVMNTEAEIVSAMQRFQSGEMGRLGPTPPKTTADISNA
jgi:redox-sensitive bicupin YhaK (pirin superfamily)